MARRKKKKQKKSGRAVWTVCFLIALSVFCFSAYHLIRIYLDYKEGTDEYDELRQFTAVVTATPEPTAVPEADSTEPGQTQTPLQSEQLLVPPLSVDFASLEQINPDIRGWLYIEALDISYPVVQGADNEEYLHTTYEGTSNYAGSIFIDFQNSGDFADSNTIVYGHNMKNQSMFGKLKQLKEQEKYRNSVYFWILTPEQDYCYQIFSAFYTEADSEVYTLFTDADDAFAEYLGKMADQTQIPVERPGLQADSKIVTLSTCASRDSSGRFVVQGVRLE